MSNQQGHPGSPPDRIVGEAEQGRVRMELDSTGDLVGVTIDPRARRLDSDDLAAAILTAFQQARSALHDRLVMEPFRDRAEQQTDQESDQESDQEAELRDALADAERRIGTLTEMAAEFNSKISRLL